jgi:hypothetical protein
MPRPSWLANQEWLDSYHPASAGKRTIVKAGDEIPLKGLQVQVVSSDQHVIAKVVNGGAECKGNWIKASVGQDGKFTVTNGRNKFSNTYTAR